AEPNVAITSSKALRPVFITGGEASEAAQTVTVSLRRYGDGLDKPAATRVSVRLMQADREPQAQRTTGTVNWTPGQREASITLVVDPPRTTASTSADPRRPATGIVIAEIDTADAVAGDNTARLPVISRETLRVGVLADATARGSSLSAGTADRFRPGQWVNLALRPSESAPVDLVELEPGALDAARTAGLDAVVILSPESLAPADAPGPAAANGWTRLKPFVDQGGLLVITPAFEAASQQWSQALSAGLGVSLSVAQAPREFPTDAPGRLSGAAPPDLGPIDALATLRAELEPLARPVAITRLLPPLESPTGSQAGEESRVLLRTTDGAPFVTLLTARPDGGRSGAVIYLSSAFDLRWTDLPAKPLMVPLLQELIR
ncbi:MAG: hypothetical protein K2X91_15380, partial [Thermoleophilia bacterium]|nr:hypothetical protein [Thermoleophilia bacterium]